MVFDAIQAHIDWDSELLVRGQFCGSEGNKPFRKRSINFERAAVQRLACDYHRADSRPPTSFTDAAIALQGLVLFDHHKSWRFQYANQPGSYYLRKYADQLGLWGQTVVDQIRRPRMSGERWDPVPAATELLAIGARMAGRPVASKTSLDDQIAAIFTSLDGVDSSRRSPAWADLFRTLRPRESLRDSASPHCLHERRLAPRPGN